MKSLSFIALSFLLAHIPTILAEETVTLVEKPSSTFTLGQPHATKASDATPSSTPTTLATSTSVVQATRHQTQQYTSVPSASGGYGSYGSNAVNTEGGASGTSTSSFNLSKGALIAIIVVVVSVAVFGIASVVLYIVAKRRQWNIRQSIKRASRRLTGRPPPPNTRDDATQRKRSGIVAGSRSETRAAHPPGHKRGVVVEVKDEEKGPLDYGTPPKTKKPRENTWIGRLWGNDWK